MFARVQILVAVGLLLAPGYTNAQVVDHKQLIGTLARLNQAAPEVDVALLAEEVTANAGKGVASLPNWQNLSRLSQLVVEIDFENDSTAIETESYRTIGMIADALHHPNLSRYKFLVVGHTSSTGDAKHNLKLSQERADAIAYALSTTFAVPADRLYPIGVGKEWPFDAGKPAAADNRRVQLINLGLVR
ncbi:OmpA family protein (plasmid) [Rhizobium leguminosarum]|uniref:OmpA family protein n=1 Tax=Rhizobium leguminosarum TaxID=384 RepID=UPI00144104F4|nr:OmpA family protein [Rhizobium leguminosarum]MBY5835710.1 OmpA family protein [Rhizobium leguminosarum]NKM82171.1 OmpA family protein [Rhizobium leguminosarum bv. viciae]QSZ11912.1 OmpA family protein [Rhizobium leguminosarum]